MIGCRWPSMRRPVFFPWFEMTDTRIPAIKTAGTVILLNTGVFMVAGRWNGDGNMWVSESGALIDEPWQWMPMPDPVNE